jgi:hypothetical protein
MARSSRRVATNDAPHRSISFDSVLQQTCGILSLGQAAIDVAKTTCGSSSKYRLRNSLRVDYRSHRRSSFAPRSNDRGESINNAPITRCRTVGHQHVRIVSYDESRTQARPRAVNAMVGVSARRIASRVMVCSTRARFHTNEEKIGKERWARWWCVDRVGTDRALSAAADGRLDRDLCQSQVAPLLLQYLKYRLKIRRGQH